ncbi:MAG TPA: hypothetical protein HA283_00600 [Nanoarchaeota archaeon]|nr:hypothetical protein [Nanoarchaeota archaeon]
MEQFITIENLSTMAGLILVVVLLTQNFKGIIDTIFIKYFGKSLPTQYLVFVISQVLLFMSKHFLGTNIFSGQEIFINFINGCILSGVSMKSVETLMSKNNIDVNK